MCHDFYSNTAEQESNTETELDQRPCSLSGFAEFVNEINLWLCNPHPSLSLSLSLTHLAGWMDLSSDSTSTNRNHGEINDSIYFCTELIFEISVNILAFLSRILITNRTLKVFANRKRKYEHMRAHVFPWSLSLKDVELDTRLLHKQMWYATEKGTRKQNDSNKAWRIPSERCHRISYTVCLSHQCTLALIELF